MYMYTYIHRALIYTYIHSTILPYPYKYMGYIDTDIPRVRVQVGG